MPTEIPGNDSLLELPRMLRDPLTFLKERYARYGEVFRTRFIFPATFVVGPEANKLVHVTKRESMSYAKGFKNLAFARLFAHSLIMEDGAEHKHDRDILQPAMGRLALGEALPTVREIWERTAASIRPGEIDDLHAIAQRTTFEVSANVLMGLNLKSELDEVKPLFEALANGTMQSTKLAYPGSPLRKGLQARDELIRILAPKIEAARTGEPHGMLGLLAQSKEPDGSPIATRRIAEHLLLLYWAGYDTTASTGSWALWELATSPQWQDKLYEEQRRVLGDGPVTMEAQLPHQTMVLREIERLRPAAIFFPRELIEDVEFAGHTVKKGSLIMYTPYMTHRMPTLFPDPDAFKPERWDSSATPGSGGSKLNPVTALVGFGGGPRICLGKAFAQMQLKVMLTSILSRFRMEPAPGAKMVPIPLPMYRPSGARVQFHPRGAAGAFGDAGLKATA